MKHLFSAVMIAFCWFLLPGCQTADPAQHTPTVNVIYNVSGAIEVWTDTAGAAQSTQEGPDVDADLDITPPDPTDVVDVIE